MLIKYVLILVTNTILMLNSSVEAEVNNYIVGNDEYKLTRTIDDFFNEHPNEKKVFWSPIVRGKSRYSFSIPRDGHKIAGKYADASALFYLSEQIDDGLNFQPNKSKKIDIILLQNNFNLSLNQNILSDMEIGLFLKNKEKTSFGLSLNKEVIISKNALSNFGIEQAKDEHTIFNAKFVKLSSNENSEFYGNINHSYKSDHINIGIGNTWFEILNYFDFTLGIQEHDKKVMSELYASFGYENINFQVGLDYGKNSSNKNIFFNIKLKNILNNKKLGTNATLTSKDSIFGLRNLSLKGFRGKNLDVLWRKYMNYY